MELVVGDVCDAELLERIVPGHDASPVPLFRTRMLELLDGRSGYDAWRCNRAKRNVNE